MLLKRVYDPADVSRYHAALARAVDEEARAQVAPPAALGVQLKHTGINPAQNFSVDLVMQAVSSGWMSISGDTLILHAAPEDLHYAIVRRPGYYCCHDGKRIPISELAMQEALTQPQAKLAAAEARAYLALHGFAGVPSPDAQHPSGYLRCNAFECVLDSAQHDKYQACRGALAMSMNPGA